MPWIDRIVDLAIEEDLGRGDVTTRLTVPVGLETIGRAVAREDLVMSGGDVFLAVMHRVDPRIDVEIMVEDGNRAAAGKPLIRAKGRVASLLMAERVALNFLQRLCGVAALTQKFIDALPEGSKVRVTDTRKTTPGMRFLERRAVLHGGGHNHRVDLAGGVLIKENHVAAAGSMEAAVRRCLDGAPHPLRVEAEVRSDTELNAALKAGVDAVLLDNMRPKDIERCVGIVQGRAFVEASGGIDLETIAAVAVTGVDAVSIGALTHSAEAADISFLLEGA
ncbi:MAG: carboxylating nicotinate-nucleotide diphosphorylase [Deltaproteobacteria bacterium]|nr:carboxylating nicotinate-nucleotide diphosphorylase [Deltaproteobacteria bacterium]